MTADIADAKKSLRNRLGRARREMPPAASVRQNAALVDLSVALLRDRSAKTVAAYSPMPTEPGGPDFLSTLAGHCTTVLLPISGPEGELLWSPYTGADAMAPGSLSIPEPTGRRRDWRALLDCEIIFVPALGVTSRGFRLGKGAGYYDRALGHLESVDGPRPLLAAMLFDAEITDDIPVEEHDMPVDVVLTPGGIFRP